MRILHVTPTADLASGGPIEGIRARGVFLQAEGHTVEVLTGDAPDAGYLAGFPLKVHAKGPSQGGFAKAPEMEKWLDEHFADYDAVIANGIWQYPNLAVRNAASRAKRPYWVFTHGMLDPYFNRAFPLKRIKKMLYWPWQHAVLRDARAVLFTCEEEKILARESFRPYRVRERVVSYGTSDPTGDPEGQKRAFEAAFPALAGKRYLLFLSRVNPKKGPDLLLKAFIELAARDPELHLAMAGPAEPEYQKSLEAIVAGKPGADRVHWLGMLKGDVKYGAFRNAEAFILPSHQENFGIAVAEALACGVPVLITKPVNIWREIDEDGAGYVDEDTEEGVAGLIARWIDTPSEIRQRMAESARRCFLDRFTIQKSAESLLEALAE